MRKKEDPTFTLAKELFLKSYKPQLFINDQSIKQYEADVDNAIKVAEFFVGRFNEHKAVDSR